MFLDEIAAYLVVQGVGVKGANIFLGSNADIPGPDKGDGPYLLLKETGGTSPLRRNTSKTRRPTAQISVRAKSYKTARTMAESAYNALDGVSNTTLSGVAYQNIRALQEPTDIGLDESGRPMIVFNIRVDKSS